MAITTVTTSRTYLSTTSVPASKTIKGSPFTMAIRAYCVTSGSSVLDSGGDVGTYIAIVGSTLVGAAFANWASVGNSSSIGSVYCDMSHASTTEEIFVEFGATSNNTWVHWAATYDGTGAASGVKIYKNGALVTPVSSGGTLTTSDAWDRILVGGQDGDVQDAWCFNRVLTAAEILQLSQSRFPKIDRTSIVGHWPLMPGSTFGQDFSGNGRTLSATATPTAATRNPGVIWIADAPTIIIPAASALSLATAGTTNTTGSVALTALEALAPSGSTQTTGAVALGVLEALAPSGTTNVTGSVALTELAAVAPAGTTSVTGAVTLGMTAALVPSGTTNTTGSVALGASATIAPAGTTNTTGAVALTQLAAISPAGTTATTGAVTLGSSGGGLPLAPSGTTNVTGAVALTALEAVQPSGTTQTTGAVSLGMTAALAPAGSTQTTGFVALGQLLQLPAAGSTNTTGAVAFAKLAALAPTGTTNVTGAVAMGKVIAFPSAGNTACFGSVTLTGGTPVASGTPKQSSSRRSMSYSGRRHGRV